MPSFEECLGRLTGVHGLSEEEALDVLQNVSDRADELREGGVSNPHHAAAAALGDEFEAAAKSERLTAINRVLDKHDVVSQLREEERRLMAISAATRTEFAPIETPWWRSGARSGARGVAREVGSAALDAWRLVTKPYERLAAPEAARTFSEAPAQIRLENLHPEDAAELQRTAEGLAKANDMEQAYKAAAACLKGVL